VTVPNTFLRLAAPLIVGAAVWFIVFWTALAILAKPGTHDQEGEAAEAIIIGFIVGCIAIQFALKRLTPRNMSE
jgi:hypothetical protein